MPRSRGRSISPWKRGGMTLVATKWNCFRPSIEPSGEWGPLARTIACGSTKNELPFDATRDPPFEGPRLDFEIIRSFAAPSHPPSTHRELPHPGDRANGAIVRCPQCKKHRTGAWIAATTPPYVAVPTHGAVTHGNSTGSGGTCRGGKESPQATPRSEQRLLSALRDLEGRGTRGREAGAHVHGGQGGARHHQILGRRRLSLRAAAGCERVGHWWRWNPGLRLRGRK